MVEKMRSPRNLHRLAMIGWSLIALAYLAFFLTDLRLDFAQLQIPCTGADCNYLAISQAEVDVLESWGLSSRTYSVIMNGATMLAVAASWLLGSLILWRQGTSLIGWSVSLALIILPITMISDADNVAAHFPGLLIPTVFLSLAGYFILCLFLYLFPNGRWYPRWSFVTFIMAFLVFAVFNLDFIGLITIPPWVLQLDILGGVVLFSLTGGFQILRYRRVSTPLERQQTKWIILAICILLLGFPIWVILFGALLDIPSGLPRLAASLGGWLFTMFVISALPVTMAIAIMRYRLWDIDLVIRRTLQYSLLSGLLALTYFGIVIILQSVFRALTGQSENQLITVASTLAIAALFFPLRNRVQAFIDRRFYRKQYDAQKVLAEFAATCRDETDLDKLTARLVEVVDEAMQPEKVSLWLKPEPRTQGRSQEGRP
jgi:hypothetical protein